MRVFRKNILYIYTDGSSLQKPRKGGIGIRYIILDESESEIITDKFCFGYKEASNNQMELFACVEALRMTSKLDVGYYNSIEIRSDSKYVVENVNNAKFVWPKQRWLNSDGKPILNVELWQKLTKQIQRTAYRVDFTWVKGHAKDEHNKAVDKNAKLSAKSALNSPLSKVTIRRKRTNEKTKIGSVKNSGQKVGIRIVTSEFLREQKLAKYRYEIVSKGSKYYGKIDFAYSECIMRDGHSYFVTFNKNQKNPRILKVLFEIE